MNCNHKLMCIHIMCCWMIGIQHYNSKFEFYILDSNFDSLKWLVDVTIGYPEHKDMNLQTILFGTRNPCQTTVYFRKFPIMDVPLEGEALTKWLNDRFVEKEEMLDVFYKTGKFPTWNK